MCEEIIKSILDDIISKIIMSHAIEHMVNTSSDYSDMRLKYG